MHEGIVSGARYLHSAAVATGNGSEFEITGYAWVTFQVNGISGDTIIPEVTIDGTNWETARAIAVDGINSVTSITADNNYAVRVGGMRRFRARISVYSAGSITVMAHATSLSPFPAGYGQSAGKFSNSFTISPTVDTAAYSVGDLIGAKNTLTDAVRVSGGGGVIQTVVVADLADQKAALDLVFFNADPSATTFTDQTALDIDDADLFRIIGVLEIVGTDYNAFADNAVATFRNLGLAFEASGSADIYMAIVSRGSPTYASTADMQIYVTILQD